MLSDPVDPAEAMDTQANPTAGTTITIPPSEMLKLSELLKDTFRAEIVGLFDTIVKGVVTGLQDRIESLEKSNKTFRRQTIYLQLELLFSRHRQIKPSSIVEGTACASPVFLKRLMRIQTT